MKTLKHGILLSVVICLLLAGIMTTSQVSVAIAEDTTNPELPLEPPAPPDEQTPPDDSTNVPNSIPDEDQGSFIGSILDFITE